MALLLASLGIFGLTVDTDINIWGGHGKINPVTAPLHLYRTVVLESAVQGITKELHQRRPMLAPRQGIDSTLTRQLWTGSAAEQAGAPSKRHMLALAGGGHWRQHRVHAIDAAQSEVCLLCGQGRDDDDHLWYCNSLQHIHHRHERALRCKDHLPTALKRYGLAPHVTTDPEQLLWGRARKRFVQQ